MTRALLLAIGLTIAGYSAASTTTGSIAVSLTILSRCEIDAIPSPRSPRVNCDGHARAQPRITQSKLNADAKRKVEAQLVTVEW